MGKSAKANSKNHKKSKANNVKQNKEMECMGFNTQNQLADILQLVRKLENIDYDKLERTIISAQKKSSESDSIFSGMMASLICILFRVLSIIGVVVLIALFANLKYFSETLIGNTFGYKVLFYSILAALWLFILMLTILFHKSANEFKTEKDKQYVVTAFSAMSGFVAMIIALIALLK